MLDSESHPPRRDYLSPDTTTVTMVIEGHISRTRIPPITVLDAPGRRVIDRQGIITGLMHKIGKRAEAIAECRSPERIGRKKFAEVSKFYGREIAELIMQTRLRFNLLIDSSGGATVMQDNWSQTIEGLNSDGHATASYVSGEASSAAAFLTNDTSELYATESSLFLWHPVRREEEQPFDPAEIRQRFHEKVRPYFENHVPAEKKAEITILLDRAESKADENDCKLVMTAAELMRFGLHIGSVTQDTSELLELFAMHNNFDRGSANLDDPRYCFFVQRILKERLRMKVQEDCATLRIHGNIDFNVTILEKSIRISSLSQNRFSCSPLFKNLVGSSVVEILEEFRIDPSDRRIVINGTSVSGRSL